MCWRAAPAAHEDFHISCATADSCVIHASNSAPGILRAIVRVVGKLGRMQPVDVAKRRQQRYTSRTELTS
eukprot:1461733-Rhodomonas_salina.4